MKISDIETKIEHGDCSEETLELFKAALKRVPKSNRCQHCYTTAASMPPRFYKQAVEMIQYGLEQCDSWFHRMGSHYNMAIILEKSGDYVGAKKAYENALASVDSAKQSGYDSEFAAHMMRMEMHINDFKCSDALENYYNIAIQANEFSQSFKRTAFYRLVAEVIIFMERGDLAGARKALKTADNMLRPDFIGPLTPLLKRKGFDEKTGATKEAIAFLRRAARKL